MTFWQLLTAAMPLFSVFILLVLCRLPARQAMPLSLLLSAILAYWVWQMPALQLSAAVLEGLADAVTNRTQVQTSVINPFKGLALGSSIREKQLAIDAPGLLTGAGLAMRRFEA